MISLVGIKLLHSEFCVSVCILLKPVLQIGPCMLSSLASVPVWFAINPAIFSQMTFNNKGCQHRTCVMCEIQCGLTTVNGCALCMLVKTSPEQPGQRQQQMRKAEHQSSVKILSTSSSFCMQIPMKWNHLFFLHLFISPHPP